jgi:hypothetical protein
MQEFAYFCQAVFWLVAAGVIGAWFGPYVWRAMRRMD